jgi:arylsulfatase A-like enzyme
MIALVVYNANFRLIASGDSYPARFIPFAVWGAGTVYLDSVREVTIQKHPKPYWIRQAPNGHTASLYPIVTPLLVTPLYAPAVLYLQRFGWSYENLDRLGKLMEKVSASCVASVAVFLMFLALRRRLGRRDALLLTGAFAFGTDTWAVSSQALWQHGPAEMVVVAALWFITGEPSRVNALVAGLATGLLAANRPPDLVIAAGLSLYALFWARRRVVLFALAAAVPILLGLAFNLITFRQLGGGYEAGGAARLSFFSRPILPGIGGLLVSPGVGLFVFCPFLLFLLFLFPRSLLDVEHRLLTVSLACGVILLILVYAPTDWRGGYAYGPRYLTDAVPILIWMLAPVLTSLSRVARIVFVTCCLFAVGVQYIGAFHFTGKAFVTYYTPPPGPGEMYNVWLLKDAGFLIEGRNPRQPRELWHILRSLAHPALPPSLPPALRDPMVLSVDGLAPGNGFDGVGSLFLGDGWGRPESGGNSGDWKSMAWVVGREAVVHLLLPPSSQRDFFARCLPYPWDAGSPQQEMELSIGNQVVGRVELIRDWQDVRISLPDDLPEGHLLDLRLRFAHALKPLDRGGNDPRSLAAAFTQLAVIPHEVADPKAFLDSHAFDPKTGKVILPAGGGLRLPLPSASHVELQISSLSSNCQGCQLSMELTGPRETPRLVYSGEQGGQGPVEVSFDTEARGIQSLWIRVSASPSPRPLATMEFVLGPVDARPHASMRRGEAVPPSVFIYMIDTLRADELRAYGGKPALTPWMDAFAREAVTYSQARAPSSWTLPSVVSLLTGLYPDRHGVMAGEFQLDPGRQISLQRILGERGYRTVGISHSFIASSAYGVDTGFGSFYFRNHLNGTQLHSEEARGLLATWLSRYADGTPIFAYLHTVDPHAPYTPPAAFRPPAGPPEGLQSLASGLPDSLLGSGKELTPAAVAYLRALYDGEVRYTDHEFGRFVELLKWLGLYDRSYVILVGDHGEEFAEHGGLEHGRTLFEEVLRVPLIVKYPGGPGAGGTVNTPVSLVDIAPTLLAGLADTRGPAFDGKVLPVPGDTPRRDQPVYFEVAPAHDPNASAVPVDLRGLVVEGIKCIENRVKVDRSGRPTPTLQAFNLAADPREQRPLAPDGSETSRCRQLLDSWSAVRERQVKEQRSRREASPETRERLRALGYLN